MSVNLQHLHLISAIGGGHDPKLTAGAMNICYNQCEFGKATLLTHTDRPPNLHPEIAHVKIAPMDVVRYSKFMLTEFHRYVECEKALVVQHDGFILNPIMWNPRMAEYDYIGAPWPTNRPSHCRVGNGGFSIRSKRLHRFIAEEMIGSHLKPWLGNNEDEYICTTHREYLEKQGFIFAPADLAARFSIEFKTWHHDDLGIESFGFHGFYDGRERHFNKLQQELHK